MSPDARGGSRFRVPRPSNFWGVVIAEVGCWLLLKFVFPVFSMWVTGGPRPLPIPGAAMAIYMILLLAGALVYVVISDEAIAEFVRPVVAFLRGPADDAGALRLKRWARLAVLVLIPLAVAGAVYSETAPRLQSPALLRSRHPTIPGAYEKLKNHGLGTSWRAPTSSAPRSRARRPPTRISCAS